MDTAAVLLCRHSTQGLTSQCKAKPYAKCTVLRHRWEPESSKESSISFLLVEKEEKKLSAEH